MVSRFRLRGSRVENEISLDILLCVCGPRQGSFQVPEIENSASMKALCPDSSLSLVFEPPDEARVCSSRGSSKGCRIPTCPWQLRVFSCLPPAECLAQAGSRLSSGRHGGWPLRAAPKGERVRNGVEAADGTYPVGGGIRLG